MTNVKISPASELHEVRALVDHYRNRNLILSQALEELNGIIAERDARIAELEGMVTPEAEPVTEETAQVH